MKIVAIIAALLLCCLMFVVRRDTKAALLIVGAMTMTLVSVPGIPLHKANILLQVCFLLSEWKHLPFFFQQLRRVPYLPKLLILVSVGVLIAGLTSPYTGLGTLVQTELLFKYFALAYAFWAVKGTKSLKPTLRLSLYALILLTFFGVLNYITKSAAFVNALTEGKTILAYDDMSIGEVYVELSRFRVQSMFKLPFDYGFICCAMLLLHLFGWHRRLERWYEFAIALVCCLFGIITCECRIIWLCTVITVGGFYLWGFPLRRIAVLGIAMLFAFFIAYSTVGFVEESVNKVTDIFNEHSDTRGSSIAMRTAQFAVTLSIVDGNELLGMGHGYYINSRSNGAENIEGLLGLESVIFRYLLEYGIVGLAIWMTFYGWLMAVLWRNRRRQPILTAFGASVWLLYIFYAIGTGELLSVYPTMLLLGMVLKVMEYNNSRRRRSIRLHRLRMKNNKINNETLNAA